MKSKAFALVELMICIIIVAVLVALIAPVVTSAKVKAFVAQDTSNLRQAGHAMEMYRTDNNDIPNFSVKALNINGYLPSNICKSGLDHTEKGIGNNIASDIHQMFSHFDERTTFFWSHPSYVTFGQFQKDFDSRLRDYGSKGWMVSLAQCKPQTPNIFLGAVHGHYLRLLMDGSVQSRQTKWPSTEGGSGKLYSYSPLLLFADIPEDQWGAIFGTK